MLITRCRQIKMDEREKANEKAQTMKATAADRTHCHLETCMNKKRRSNEHYQRMICGTLERMKQTGMMEHSTTIDSIDCQVQFNTKYNDEDYKRRIQILLLLAQKTVNVHREVNHLYSLRPKHNQSCWHQYFISS